MRHPDIALRPLDFKQLPPATSHPVFIVSPDVYNNFDFRVLQQNRRIVAGTEDRANELNTFHEVLNDISWGEASDAVRDFIVAAYVRGGSCGVAQNCEYDGSTAIFTKRRKFWATACDTFKGVSRLAVDGAGVLWKPSLDPWLVAPHARVSLEIRPSIEALQGCLGSNHYA